MTSGGGGGDKKSRKSRRTPVAGTPVNEAEATLPPERNTPRPRKSRRTPVAIEVPPNPLESTSDASTPSTVIGSEGSEAKAAAGSEAVESSPSAVIGSDVESAAAEAKPDASTMVGSQVEPAKVESAKVESAKVEVKPEPSTVDTKPDSLQIESPATSRVDTKPETPTAIGPTATSSQIESPATSRVDTKPETPTTIGSPAEPEIPTTIASRVDTKPETPTAINPTTSSQVEAPATSRAETKPETPSVIGAPTAIGEPSSAAEDGIALGRVKTKADIPSARSGRRVGSESDISDSEPPVSLKELAARESKPDFTSEPAISRAPTKRESPAALAQVEPTPEPYKPIKLEAPRYDDPDLATMPASEEVGDISNIVIPPAGSGHIPTQAQLDPAAAAFEAARIAEQVLGGNIDTASGAAIVAAAAAGAAIEAARMRAFAGDQGVDPTTPAGGGSTSAAAAAAAAAAGAPPGTANSIAAAAAAAAAGVAEASASDPVTTVRMQRERVLRALAADVAANATSTVAAEHAAAAAAAAGANVVGGAPMAEGRAKRPSQPGYRAPSSPGVDEVEELDPVQIAAAAIQRLRQRASTDFAELRGQYQKHDIVVLVLAFVIIIIAGRVHSHLVTPPTKEFAVRGLVFQHSTTWLEPEEIPTSPPRIIRDASGQPPKKGTAYHVAYTSSLDPNARLEVFIDKKPAWSNIVTGLELDRRTRYGELYTLDDSRIKSIEDQDWLRTEYRYAHAVEKGDAPRVDRAVEYATIDREQIYVVTLFGSGQQLQRMEDVVVPTLRVPTRSGLPLVPQTRSLGQRTYPDNVSRAFDSTVMVVVADLVDGRLKARGGGSGVIVGADGSILTNYHVIHDKDGRLHDVFVIGRFSTLDRAPQLQCAGRPSRSKLQRDLDLALIKCDLDLDGRTWQPASSQIWPILPEAKTAEIKMGQRVWVLGYPDAGGGGLTLSEGSVEGWTGQDGTQGRDFIKTDASITHGNSGGPVVDDSGKLLGVAAASRTKVTASGAVVEVSQVGLVRPLPTATDLLAIAATGWTPREGYNDIEIQPSAVEAPSEGVRIGTKILDASNEAPIRDALVLVLRPSVKASSIDVNRLDDQTLAWGRSNTQGDVQLKQPVPPGTYTVMVIARGYEPLIGEGALKLTDQTPPAYDPWGQIKLLQR